LFDVYKNPFLANTIPKRPQGSKASKEKQKEQENAMSAQVCATIVMATLTTLKKTLILDKQNIMALFTMLED
jgi:hypothetical protein